MLAIAAAAAVGLAIAPGSAAFADTSVTSIAELANAFATQPSGSTITLDADLTGDDTSDTVKVPAGRTLTLDLNGHRLILVGGDPDTMGPAGLGVPAGTTLTIVDTAPGGAGALTTVGAFGGAGIGGGASEAAGTIIIDGGTITTTGGSMAAGIGGGHSRGGGAIMISGGTVTARATGDAAAIGGGVSGPGASVSIGADAVVTATTPGDVAPFGSGSSFSDSTTFGSLSNAGTLILPLYNRIDIPSGVTVTNSGTIRNGGVLGVDGTLVNTGIILNANTIFGPANVTGHNTTVLLDGNGGTAPAAPAVLYAGSFQDGELAFPADATRTGFAFDGWFTQAVGGTQVTATTDLGLGGPQSITLYARWSDPAAADDDSPELAATGSDAVPIGLTGAALLLTGLALYLRRRTAAD